MPLVTYSLIKEEVRSYIKKNRKNFNLPDLPSEKDLKIYKTIIEENFYKLLKEISIYFRNVKADKNNAIDHALWVATLAAYLADKESIRLGVNEEDKQKINYNTITAGLLHDIDRHLGVGEIHMIEGEKTAKKILSKYKINKNIIFETIRHHDDPNYEIDGLISDQIVFGSVFDADHLRYGLEREAEFWEMKERKGVKPENVIHDYHWLDPYMNAWKTKSGERIAKPWINYALAIAKHVEQKFT